MYYVFMPVVHSGIRKAPQGEAWVRGASRCTEYSLVMGSLRLDSVVREDSILDPCYDI